MKENYITDKNGTPLNVGDKVHDKWGFDLIVSQYEDGGYYGKLVCEPTDSCANIPYTLCPEDIEKLLT